VLCFALDTRVRGYDGLFVIPAKAGIQRGAAGRGTLGNNPLPQQPILPILPHPSHPSSKSGWLCTTPEVEGFLF